MKKELGKWLLDVAKYVATAFLISSFLGGIERRWVMYLASTAAVISALFVGLWLIMQDKKRKGELTMEGILIMCGLIIAIAWGAFIFAHTKAGKRFFDIKD